MTAEIVTADIGGTHARFALAAVGGGKVLRLDPPVTFKVSDFAGLPQAWKAFCASLERPAPRLAAFALATPIMGEVLQMTNNPWIVRLASLDAELGIDGHIVMNDFAAVAHAAAQLDAYHFAHLCGPQTPVASKGLLSVVGPGTGLGVASLLRARDHYHVVETSGGHIEFAPLDPVEEAIRARLSCQHGRVSVERVLSGQGLEAIVQTLAELQGAESPGFIGPELWQLALSGEDPLAAEALERFCLVLGSVAGDVVLAQGGQELIIAGGLGQRLSGKLARSGFCQRFLAKGRFRELMETIPVRLITHPQPGLYGVAAAYARIELIHV